MDMDMDMNMNKHTYYNPTSQKRVKQTNYLVNGETTLLFTTKKGASSQ
jgi:hypothetical protein